MSEFTYHADAPYSREVLGRRVLAWLIDVLIVAVVLVVLHLFLAVLGLVTFGLGWTLYVLMPAVPFFYTAGFVASAAAATPGMRLVGIRVMENTRMSRPTPAEAVVWTLLYIASMTVFAPILLVALFTRDHQTLHDILTGLAVVAAR